MGDDAIPRNRKKYYMNAVKFSDTQMGSKGTIGTGQGLRKANQFSMSRLVRNT